MSADLAAQVKQLLDERDVMRTMTAYAHAMDYSDERAWLDVFTDDAVFDVVDAVSGVRVHREEGRADLARYIANYPKPPVYQKHVMVDPVVTVDGDTAQVVAYWLVLRREANGVPQLTAFGRYRDTLVRRGHRWLIQQRLADVEANVVTAP